MKRKNTSKNSVSRNQQGQSTVEFALATALTLAFVFFFVHLSMFFAFGNLVHYATFMSARALQAASESRDDQLERAKEVAVRLLKRSAGQSGTDKYPFIAKGEGGSEIPGLIVGEGPQFQPKNRDLSWQEGVRYRFRTQIVPVPLGAGKNRDNILTLTSESWLGREPSTEECELELGKKLGGVIFDNGC